jgi:phage/plasmid-like protein (TIGR03299 family)
MAAQIESMMYRGEVPWHGIGKCVKGALSTTEAMKAAGLDWEVECQPLYLADGRKAEDGQGVVRKTDGRILGVVGPKYVPLQNLAAMNAFDGWVKSGLVELETAGSLCGGRKVWILARIVGDPLDVAPGDAVLRYVLFSTSHDGSMANRIGYVIIRVVCANTLGMAHRDAASKLVRFFHRGNVAGTMENLVDVMDVVNRDFKATAEQYKMLATRNVKAGDLEKYVRRVFGITLEEQGKRLLANIVPRFEKGRGNDAPAIKGTWWAAYNAVTEYTSHARGKDQEKRVDSIFYGQGATLNTRALEGAVELATV